MDENKIAKQLKIYRKAKNLTAQQVSYYLKDQGCHVEARSIYGYESGNRMPSVDVFLHLCQLYGCTDILFEFGYDKAQVQDLVEEMEVINRYRKLTDDEKEIARGFMDIMINVRNSQEQNNGE